MERQADHSRKDRHAVIKQKYDNVQSDGRYEEGMTRMAVYHRHCQNPVIFGALGDVRGKSLLDLACGDGFYTRRFRAECGADPVMGIDLSPKQIERAQAIEQHQPLGIDYRVGDVMERRLPKRGSATREGSCPERSQESGRPCAPPSSRPIRRAAFRRG